MPPLPHTTNKILHQHGIKTRMLLIFCIQFFSFSLFAQNTNTLLQAFQKGETHGRFRYYFMSTQNEGSLSDYFANAIGIGMKFESAKFHSFQFGAEGSFTYNIGSSALSKPDAATGQYNRYEIGLFDITDANNKSNMFRLEQLYLKYNLKSGSLKLGKQLINTPFINPQDGRMRPTYVEGAYGYLNTNNFAIEGGYLYGISPRSTEQWFNVGKSIGWYPQGISTDSSKSNYLSNTYSNGIALLGINYSVKPNCSIELWEQFAENISNTVLFQFNYHLPVSTNSKIVFGGQLIEQQTEGNGGNSAASKRYYPKGNNAWILGGRLGWTNDSWDASLNYTRITAAGIYLMPREWGRDPFFTFMPRERNEGYGDVHAFMAKVSGKISPKFKAELAAGHFSLPDANNYRLNKYGMPSYNQYNADLKYIFSKGLKGFDAELLYVYKQEVGKDFGNSKYVINKVNMSLINFIVDFHF